MQEIKIAGLPETDRVFLLDSGIYVRSRFRHKRNPEPCQHCKSCRLGAEDQHMVIRITMALCDANGELLRKTDGAPAFIKHFSFATPLESLRKKTRNDLFTEARNIAIPTFEADYIVANSFPESATDEDLS